MSGAGGPGEPNTDGDRLARDHDLLVDAVRGAGAVALSYFRRNVVRWEKKPGDPVSEADHAVDDYLKERLLAARPDYGWLSEETEDNPARLDAARAWVVDPIDGTRAFLEDKPEFTVAAALVEAGRPVAAAVFNPATDEFFEARAGRGATLNGAPMRVRHGAALSGLELLAGRSRMRKGGWLGALPRAQFHAINSIAYRIGLVAAGRYDATLSFSAKSDWDLAAADLIMGEAGGVITTLEGARLAYNRADIRHPSVLAAGPKLHAKLLALLKSG